LRKSDGVNGNEVVLVDQIKQEFKLRQGEHGESRSAEFKDRGLKEEKPLDFIEIEECQE